ncbi:C3H1-type domain-containing protein [Durusdinium trenchii]|uniref:C3H1-type domain-containing protein n=1 Tax=Durusdinium trenchii TaxID=1381693 RepID=A0ABP0M1Q8_9DINO
MKGSLRGSSDRDASKHYAHARKVHRYAGKDDLDEEDGYGRWADWVACGVRTAGALTVLTSHGYAPDLRDLLSILQSLSLSPSPTITSAKKVFERLGYRHTSLDINGRDGAQVVDLSRPLNVSLLSSCDVVTNFGTTEHVGEGEYINAPAGFELLDLWSSQYQAFRNIHQLLRGDGLIIHMVPAAGCWPRHGAVEYEPQFFQALAGAAGYEILNLSLHRPSYYWSPAEERFFWDLLHELLARESLTLPESIVPEMVSIMPHLEQAKQANVLAVFRRGPGSRGPSSRDWAVAEERFQRLPGLHWKATAALGPCLLSSKLQVSRACEEAQDAWRGWVKRPFHGDGRDGVLFDALTPTDAPKLPKRVKPRMETRSGAEDAAQAGCRVREQEKLKASPMAKEDGSHVAVCETWGSYNDQLVEIATCEVVASDVGTSALREWSQNPSVAGARVPEVWGWRAQKRQSLGRPGRVEAEPRPHAEATAAKAHSPKQNLVVFKPSVGSWGLPEHSMPPSRGAEADPQMLWRIAGCARLREVGRGVFWEGSQGFKRFEPMAGNGWRAVDNLAGGAAERRGPWHAERHALPVSHHIYDMRSMSRRNGIQLSWLELGVKFIRSATSASSSARYDLSA